MLENIFLSTGIIFTIRATYRYFLRVWNEETAFHTGDFEKIPYQAFWWVFLSCLLFITWFHYFGPVRPYIISIIMAAQLSLGPAAQDHRLEFFTATAFTNYLLLHKISELI